MNMSIKNISLVALVAFPIFSNADPLSQGSHNALLTIQEYRVKTSSLAGTTLRRAVALVATNNTGAPLYHVYLHLDGMPSHVLGEGWAYFPELGAGATQESRTTVEYAVDLSRQQGPSLELIWQIRAEIDGKPVIDEISVSETIQ